MDARSHRHVCNDEAAAPLEKFAVIDLLLCRFRRKTLGRFVFFSKELPVAHEVKGQQIAAHSIVEASVAKNEIPFC